MAPTEGCGGTHARLKAAALSAAVPRRTACTRCRLCSTATPRQGRRRFASARSDPSPGTSGRRDRRWRERRLEAPTAAADRASGSPPSRSRGCVPRTADGRRPSHRESRPARRCPSAHPRRAPRPARAPCTGWCRGRCLARSDRRLSVDRSTVSVAFEVPQFREPEIEKLDSAAGEHDVARLQIAMNHALAVGGIESAAISPASARARSTGSGPRSRRSASVSPSRSSMTRNGTPSTSPTS